MPTVLVTGANRGLGLEFTRQYAADGWRVHATCRDKSDAADLLSVEGDVVVHQIDVTDGPGIETLAADIGDEPIDVLANNAGVLEPWPSKFGNTDYEGWMNAFRVNSAAPLRLSERFVDQVARSEAKIIFAVTSHLGSIAGNSGGMYAYGSTKAALNSVMKSLALDVAERGIRVAVFHPGWARTRMGGPGAAVDPVDSVAGIRKTLADLKPEESGTFFNYDGAELPW